MARPLRIEMSFGGYSVTTRGWKRRDILRDDEDRERYRP